MKPVLLHFLFGLALLGGWSAAALGGYVPDDSVTAIAPMSVRDNPASYKPSYAVFTGFHSTSSIRTTSSGGYRSGK